MAPMLKVNMLMNKVAFKRTQGSLKNQWMDKDWLFDRNSQKAQRKPKNATTLEILPNQQPKARLSEVFF
jgi:hypothetical protein